MNLHPAQLLMPGGHKARHQVLIFHRVLASVDSMMPSEPDVGEFDRLIGKLKRIFNVIPLSEAVDMMSENRLPAASISITFDDGYADNFTQALPILEHHKVPATFFVATAFIDGGLMWNDTLIETARRLPDGDFRFPFAERKMISIRTVDDRRRLAEQAITFCKYLPVAEREECAAEFASLQDRELPDSLMMTSDQLIKMASSDYAEIGAHTRHHPILACCSDKEVIDEINGSANDLKHLLGEAPQLFAYPNGKFGQDYLRHHPALVKQMGLKAAVTTDWGVLSRKTDLYQIPRFSPWTNNPNRYVFDLLRARYDLL